MNIYPLKGQLVHFTIYCGQEKSRDSFIMCCVDKNNPEKFLLDDNKKFSDIVISLIIDVDELYFPITLHQIFVVKDDSFNESVAYQARMICFSKDDFFINDQYCLLELGSVKTDHKMDFHFDSALEHHKQIVKDSLKESSNYYMKDGFSPDALMQVFIKKPINTTIDTDNMTLQ